MPDCAVVVIAGDGANMVGVEDELTLVVLAKEAVSLVAVLLVGLDVPPFCPEPAELSDPEPELEPKPEELFDPEPEELSDAKPEPEP